MKKGISCEVPKNIVPWMPGRKMDDRMTEKAMISNESRRSQWQETMRNEMKEYTSSYLKKFNSRSL